MANNDLIWHCPDMVRNHSLSPGFLSSLADISDRDYPGKHFFTSEIPALDMDRYETSQGGDNYRTADAVVGICNERQGCPVNGRLLLVELRMNYENTRNLSVTEISEKESHTRDILRKCPDGFPLDLSFCLVFNPKVEPQAYSWLSRTQRSSSSACHWKSFSPATFSNYINAGVSMPYTPKSKTIEMGERIKSCAAQNDLGLFEKAWSDVWGYLSECALKYEHGECRYLSTQVIESLALFDRTTLKEEDDNELFQIIADEIVKVTTRHLDSCHPAPKYPTAK